MNAIKTIQVIFILCRHDDGQQVKGDSGSSIRIWARKLNSSRDPLAGFRKAEEEEKLRARQRAEEEEQTRIRAQEAEQARVREKKRLMPGKRLKKSSELDSEPKKNDGQELQKSNRLDGKLIRNSKPEGVLKNSNR